MMASNHRFVLKLPNARVEQLVVENCGERFEPGPGRVMKEWLVVTSSGIDWIELAHEAYRFVKGPS